MIRPHPLDDSPPPQDAEAPRETLIRGRNLGIRRDGRWLVRNVSLSLRRGEILTLIGPNGGGKSTTAKLLLGLLPADVGEVQRAAGLRAAYAPQSLAIDRTLPLTVRRLMQLARTNPRQSRLAALLFPVKEERNLMSVSEALERVGLSTAFLDAAVHDLSGGEFRRMLLGRAILRRPDLLVLDEPVQGVDHAGQIALYELISSIRKELDCAVLLISHDLHIVMAESDQVLCLNGHICCSGPPRKVVDDPTYRKLFGDAAASLALYTHQHDHVHCGADRILPLKPGQASASCAPSPDRNNSDA